MATAKRSPDVKLRRALIGLMRSEPFFTSIMLKLVFIPVPGLKTMGVDGKHLFYDPEFVSQYDERTLEALLIHEAMHVTCGHQLRQGIRDTWVFNIAGDLAINALIGEDRGLPMGAHMPGKGRWDKLPLKMNAELYYDKILQEFDRPKQQPPGVKKNPDGSFSPTNGGGGQGGAGNGPQGQQPSNLPDPHVTKQQQQQQSQPPPKQQPKGSGKKQELPQDLMDQTMQTGMVFPVPLDKEKGETIEQATGKWEQMISQAHIEAKNAGKCPGWLEELVDTILKPAQIPWKYALRPFLQRTIRAGFTYKRPNRRHAWRKDIIMPSHFQKGLGKIVFGVDTSGSMLSEECDLALNELDAIGKEFGDVSVQLFSVDTVITWEKLFTRYDFPLNMPKHAWRGRGGTDFHPFFERAVKENPRAIIFLTDGYPNNGWPPDPKIPTMFLITTDVKAPWGITVKMDKTAE